MIITFTNFIQLHYIIVIVRIPLHYNQMNEKKNGRDKGKGISPKKESLTSRS